MSYFESVRIKEFEDSSGLDAFGRLRVSNPLFIFDSKQTGNTPLFDIYFVSKSVGGGAVTIDPYNPSRHLTVTATSGSRVIMQTRRRMNYYPGRGLHVVETFNMGTGSVGVVKRVGYFDEYNGIFLETSGSDINLVLRSNVNGVLTENRVSQSNWNTDAWDGTSNSRQPDIFNIAKAQIMDIDFQWLGVGRVRVGFENSSGSLIHVHSFRNANLNDSVYMTSPNLPIRAEVENYVGSSANSLEFICTSVSSDGASLPLGIRRSITTTTASISMPQGVRRPIVSLKLKSGSLERNVSPVATELLSLNQGYFRWELVWNPIFSGSDNANWIPLQQSAVEYDFSRTVSVVSGVVLHAGFGTATNQIAFQASEEIITNLVLGATVDGVSDEISLVVTPIDRSAEMLAVFDFREYD